MKMVLNVIVTKANRLGKVKYQFLAILCANIITLSHGCVLGWLSPFLPLLQSDESPLKSGPLTLTEASWVGAIICFGGLIGNLSFCLLCNRIGSKRAISILAFPQIGLWLCILFGRSVEFLYVARILGGITGGGIFISIPLFVAEIASDHVRGTLGSLLLVNCNVGVLLSYTAGAYLSYFTMPYLMLILPLIFLATFSFLPDTPQYLLKQNRVHDAEQSLRFYRNCQDETKQECQRFKHDFENMQMMAKSMNDDENTSRLHFDDFLNPTARKGLLIGIALMATNQLSGCFALINYSATIFNESGSKISPNTSSIILAAIQIVGTYVSTVLVDRVGRKSLLLVSASCTAIGLFIVGLYSFLDKQLEWQMTAFDWVPVAGLSFVVFIASIGVLPLPFVVLAEVMPQNIRGIGSTICVIFLSCISFVILKTFPILLATINLYGCMWLFAIGSLLGCVFIVFGLEETKGKNLNSIKGRCMSIY